MTQEDLIRLTSPQAAKEVEQARNRSSFRPPFTKLTCDIDDVVGPYTRMEKFGSQPEVEVTYCCLKLSHIREVQGETPFEGTTYDLELSLPSSENSHAEVTQMVASAGKGSIVELKGLKGVRLEEQVHEYTGSQFVPDPNGSRTNRAGQKGDWKDMPRITRFYAVTGVGSAASNGATQVATEEELQAAKVMVVGKAHADALAALGGGEKAGIIMSSLIIGKKWIKQDAGGVYELTEAGLA